MTMSSSPSSGIIGALHSLRFDIQDALLRVRRGDIVDLGDIDTRIEQLCGGLKSESKTTRDQAEPIMTDIITALEELAESLRDAINDDDDDSDDDDDTPPHHNGSR